MGEYDITDMVGISLVVGMVVWFVTIVITSGSYQGEVTELGQSICDQEYDMDYRSYFGGELKCKQT